MIGDAPADYLDAFEEMYGGRLPWRNPVDLPDEVRERIGGFYLQVFGREPTENDLGALLDFCRSDA